MTSIQFLDKARNKHGYKYSYPNLNDMVTSNDTITVQLNGVDYNQKVSYHLQGKCPEKRVIQKTNSEFISESKAIWKDRYEYSLCDYKNAETPVTLIDTKTGITHTQIPIIHLRGNKPSTITQEDFIEMSKIVSDYSLGYDNCRYINKTTKVNLNCRDHGEFSVLPFNHLNYGQVCPKCTITKIQKQLNKELNKIYIPYSQQHTFTGCIDKYQLPFDIYIPSVMVAFDIYSSKNNDHKIKEDYCEDNYIEYILINEQSNISNIIKNYIINKVKAFR